jgi:imidazolonepropionase-like amidohydrolase
MIALKNVRIFTVSDGIIENGTILLDKGRIVKVGKSVTFPKGTRIHDLRGKCVTPGFIDAHCHIGIFNEGTGEPGNDGNDMTKPVTPQVKAADGIWPEDEAFRDALEHGITTLCIGPGSGNVVGGQMAVVKPRSLILEEMLVTDYVGLKCAFGENPKRVHGTKGVMPQTRMGVAAVLRETLNDARAYKIKRDFQLAKAKKAKKGEEPEPFIPDPAKEIVVQVLEGKKPLRAHAHRADDIQTAIRIAEEFKVKLVVEHCTEGWKIADFLARKKIPAIIGPINSTKTKVELRDASLKAARILDEAGVTFALMTDAPVERIGSLWDDARLAIRQGLNPETAMKLVTLNAARILGMEDRFGSIEPGKDADLVIFSGDPYDFRSVCTAVLVDGIVRYGALDE